MPPSPTTQAVTSDRGAPRIERTVVAGRPRRLLDWDEIRQYRDLLRFLTRRQILARYKQTLLGVLWAVIQPVLTMVVFSVVLGGMVGVPSEGIPYPVYAYLGILLWQLASSVVARTTMSVVGNAGLITQVYFPRIVLPASATLSAVVDYAIAWVVLFVIMAVYGVAPHWTTLLLPLVVAATAVVAMGIGMGFAALNVRYRDVGQVLPLLLQLWMFATPVVYPAALVPERWRLLYAMNPMAGLVEAHRAAVLGHGPDLILLGISLASGLVLAALGGRLFLRMERRFADIV
ncbi:MAG: ABC transporter permease [Planctomycetota bacterium]